MKNEERLGMRSCIEHGHYGSVSRDERENPSCDDPTRLITKKIGSWFTQLNKVAKIIVGLLLLASIVCVFMKQIFIFRNKKMLGNPQKRCNPNLACAECCFFVDFESDFGQFSDKLYKPDPLIFPGCSPCFN